MELQRLGANVAVINLNNGARILFSYDTPVAAFIPGEGYIKSERFFSRTTTAHVAEFLRGNHGVKVTHETIAKLAQEAR